MCNIPSNTPRSLWFTLLFPFRFETTSMGPVRGNRDAAKTVAAPSAAILIPTWDNWSIVLPAWVPKASQMYTKAGLKFGHIWQNSPQVTWLWRPAIAAGIFDMWEARGNKKAAVTQQTNTIFWILKVSPMELYYISVRYSELLQFLLQSQSQLNSPCPFQKAKDIN